MEHPSSLVGIFVIKLSPKNACLFEYRYRLKLNIQEKAAGYLLGCKPDDEMDICCICCNSAVN